MYVYVCLYACMYGVCMGVCVCVCMYVTMSRAGVSMTLLCTHGRVSGPSSLLDLEVMAPRGYSVPCQL